MNSSTIKRIFAALKFIDEFFRRNTKETYIRNYIASRCW
ncbi:hypothetical protein T190130A13A_60034 [Tenacibaculum sp. 190130A14a]